MDGWMDGDWSVCDTFVECERSGTNCTKHGELCCWVVTQVPATLSNLETDNSDCIAWSKSVLLEPRVDQMYILGLCLKLPCIM